MSATDPFDDAGSGHEGPNDRHDRDSDVQPISGARALVRLAIELHQAGYTGAARGAVMDALTVWADAPGEVEKEEMAELLEAIGGVQARAILDVVAAAGALAAFHRRR